MNNIKNEIYIFAINKPNAMKKNRNINNIFIVLLFAY